MANVRVVDTRDMSVGYREQAISEIMRLTGAPRSWAEEVADVETAAYWFGRYMSDESTQSYAPSNYVQAALYDHGFGSDGVFYSDDPSDKPDWL